MDAGETFVVDPSGAVSPATPENRERARRLWNESKVTDMMTSNLFDQAEVERDVTVDIPSMKRPVPVNDPEVLMMKQAAAELRAQALAYEREREREQAVEQERERERERMYQAEREREQDMLDRQERAVSLREREQRATMLDLEIREREMKLLQQKKNVDCEREQADEVSSESDDDCEPNLCDPSVDVVLVASSWMVLPEDLQSYGRYMFTSYAELFEHLWKQYPALKNHSIVSLVVQVSSLHFQNSRMP